MLPVGFSRTREDQVANRILNKTQEAKGRVKETSGKATGNKVLEAQGKADQLKAQTRQAGTEVKNAVPKAKKIVTR